MVKNSVFTHHYIIKSEIFNHIIHLIKLKKWIKTH